MKIKKTVADVVVVIGIILILCAAGGSDTGTFGIEQTLLRVMIGIILIIGGGIYGVYVRKNI